MDYQQIINMLQLVILNDPTPPVANSQEFLQYSGLIYTLGIRSWENERGVLWKGLRTPIYNSFTLAAGTPPNANVFSLPANFKFFFQGEVLLTYPSGAQRTMKIKMIEDQFFNPYSQGQEFYCYGNPSTGYFLVPGWTINATDPEVGATISYVYYKTATAPTLDSNGNITNLTAVPEMDDPNYIVWTVANQIQGGNYNPNMQTDAGNKAAYAMSQMRIGNEMPASYEDNYIKDVDYLLRHQGNKRNPNTTYPQEYFN